MMLGVPRVEGYVCETGCGATVTIEPGDTLTRNGWYTTYTPAGEPTLYTCSAQCLERAAHRLVTKAYGSADPITTGDRT